MSVDLVVKCSISIFCRASGNFLFRNANLCTLASRRVEMQVLFSSTVQGREGSLITLLTLGGESDNTAATETVIWSTAIPRWFSNSKENYKPRSVELICHNSRFVRRLTNELNDS